MSLFPWAEASKAMETVRRLQNIITGATLMELQCAMRLLQKQAKKIHMIGLDVTRKIVLTPNILEYICRLDPKTGEFIRRITGFYMDFHWEYEGIIGCVINDPLAVAYFTDRDMCTGF